MHIFFKTDLKEHYKEMNIPLHVNFTYILKKTIETLLCLFKNSSYILWMHA